jgi:hypothetical protein
MQTVARDTRRMIGCGYEPALAGAKPWMPPVGSPISYRHSLPVICAGYTTRLPEVVEVSRAHASWTHGSLQAFCGADHPSEVLVALVEVFDLELSAMKRWLSTPVKDGGGRD